MPKAIAKPTPKTTPEQEADYALSVKMLNEIRDFWVSHCDDQKMDQVRLYRIGVVAFSQWAAIVGVDIGMTVDQFTNVCRANFEQAYAQAPKFGA